MSAYSTGSVKVIVGSATVKGTGTDFVTYVSAGDIFKVSSDSAWYEVAAVVDATDVTLTSRYANTSYQTSRSGTEASIGTATKVYASTLSNTPVIQQTLVLTASTEVFTDSSGNGILTSDASPAGSGTINYDTGAWSIVLGTNLGGTQNVVASYYSGNTLNAMPYQIVTDYTTHYSFPELSANDTGFNYIFTKAMRLIDSAIYNASFNTVAANSATIDSISASNIVATTGDIGTGHITTFTSNDVEATTVHADTLTASDFTATIIKTTRYLQMGTHQYIFFGDSNTESVIVAAATAVDASVKGSLYISNGTAAQMWLFDADNAATKMQSY